MNRPGYYDAKGKQAMLFGNSSMGGIILITILFLLNAALIFCIDSCLLYNIPANESGEPKLEEHIPGNILDIHHIDTGVLLLYETQNGELKIAKAIRNTIHRYNLDLDVAAITDDLYIHDTVTLDFTVENRQITKASQLNLIRPQYEIGIIIALSFLLTALERELLQKLRGN